VLIRIVELADFIQRKSLRVLGNGEIWLSLFDDRGGGRWNPSEGLTFHLFLELVRGHRDGELEPALVLLTYRLTTH